MKNGEKEIPAKRGEKGRRKIGVNESETILVLFPCLVYIGPFEKSLGGEFFYCP